MRSTSFIVLGAFLAMPGCRGDFTSPSTPVDASWSAEAVTAAAVDPVVLVVAGDIHANCVNPAHRSKATATIVEKLPQALVIPLGDNAGQFGTTAEYQCYDLSWGKFKSRTYSTIGNHELSQDSAATAYYDYFNGVGVDSGKAGHRGRGYYTLTYGGWRILVANSHRNVAAQTTWMTRVLAADPKRCTMAIWHRPFFTSSAEPANVQQSKYLRPWWNALYNGRVELVLNGHVHSYERFAQRRPDGAVDTARGIREFVVGTGGSGLYDFGSPQTGSQKRLKAFGVLKLTLWPNRYKWEFIDLDGAVLDQGSRRCH